MLPSFLIRQFKLRSVSKKGWWQVRLSLMQAIALTLNHHNYKLPSREQLLCFTSCTRYSLYTNFMLMTVLKVFYHL